ncbi:hypothetical protein TWF225_000181 [Orbilia oligospora]|uniref:Uncharacterized protein n=1 Tax=Orbilia oligospora TaxID=2813651 RepID=A0A7C8TWD1_ORBOL|nr:hypothetical protein TWF751_004214 [Orbilia oligospora]KAF3195802.1 hypothetical protein TWF225_000181 [Orbilia oligospora]KAF3266381.1 hypothetical protein TWF128_010793 [Orbilia oligospora]KAF3272282.1 hypothetical protein TWF217_004073 [Orbilia oligospora]KAF3297549.1 hypothetical protein TWF132_005972 [Orbilia oligospora]
MRLTALLHCSRLRDPIRHEKPKKVSLGQAINHSHEERMNWLIFRRIRPHWQNGTLQEETVKHTSNDLDIRETIISCPTCHQAPVIERKCPISPHQTYIL